MHILHEYVSTFFAVGYLTLSSVDALLTYRKNITTDSGKWWKTDLRQGELDEEESSVALL